MAPTNILTGGKSVVDAVQVFSLEGRRFSASHIFEDVAADASVYLHLHTAECNCLCFVSWEIGCEAQSKFFLTKNADIIANGTVVEINNRNQRSDITALSPAYHTPTIGGGGEGLIIDQGVIPGGSGVFQTGFVDQGLRWGLDQGVHYLLKVTNGSDFAIDISAQFDWFEIPT
jgi:hypothetical protein